MLSIGKTKLTLSLIGALLLMFFCSYRAISAWYDGREWFNSLCKTVMEQDWSWNRPALEYIELYHSARK